MRNRIPALLAALSLALLLSACGGGGSTPPPPPPVTVSVSPSSATVPAQGTQLFTALVSNTNNRAVTWQVNGISGGDATVGTITAGGVYTAPNLVPNPANVTVTAISQADATKADTASVTVTVGITVFPPATEVLIGQAQTFSATVTGDPNTNVTWSVNCVTPPGAPSCAPGTLGTIDASGLYTAPSAIPDNVLTALDTQLQQLQPAASTIVVTAAWQGDPSQTATGSVYVNAGGPRINRDTQFAPPIALGTSGGNETDITGNFCCSGTLGALVDRNGTKYVLSNNHVLAKRDQARVGDNIDQPGLVDSNCSPEQIVAHFSQAVRLRNPNNKAPADAAIGQIVSGQVDTTGIVLQFGSVSSGLAAPAFPGNPVITCNPPDSSCVVGLPVAKSGRTSGLSCSTISAVNVDGIPVGYETGCNGGTSFTVTYDNQIVIDSSSFGAPGDSGSLIVNAQTAQTVGLLFAGSDTETVANPINDVLFNLPDGANPPHRPTMVAGAQHEVAACTGNIGPAPPKPHDISEWKKTEDVEVQRVLAVKEAHVKELLSIPAVIGVGVGASDKPGKAAIVIFVEKGKKPGAIPAELDGVKTRIRETKPFHSFTKIPWCPAKDKDKDKDDKKNDKGITDPASLSGSLHQIGFWDPTVPGYGEARLQSRQHAPCVK